MGHRFDKQEPSGKSGTRRGTVPAGIAMCLLAAVAIAGCGENSGKSASVATTATAAAKTATKPATTPTTPTTPATTSTAAKPPAKSSKSSKSPAHTTSTQAKPPATKASAKPSNSSESASSSFGKIKLTSTAFKPGGPISAQYTCDGADISPPLQWHDVPHGTAELFLLAIDLGGSSSEAIQWSVAGISPSSSGIPAGGLPPGAVAGLNSAGKVGWSGICGAKGQLQRVAFLFYALNHKLDLKSGFNPIQARSGLKGATLATGLTAATYKRP